MIGANAESCLFEHLFPRTSLGPLEMLAVDRFPTHNEHEAAERDGLEAYLSSKPATEPAPERR